MSFLNGNKHDIENERVDEDRLQQSHDKLYNQGGGSQQHDSQSLGAGAAMQAFKMFSGGSGSSGQSSGGGGQAQMISMAMQEASKLFDKQNAQGNVAGGTDKQSVINSAAKMALQMYMKNGMGGGGGSSGGLGGLMSMASQFMK